jgi:phosphate transport system permease protein
VSTSLVKGGGYMRLYIQKRKIINKIFSILCLSLTAVPLSFLFFMLFSILSNVYYAVQQTKILIDLDQLKMEKSLSRYQIKKKLIDGLYEELQKDIKLKDITSIIKLTSDNSVYEIIENLEKGKKTLWITASSEVDFLCKHNDVHNSDLFQIIEYLKTNKRIKKFFNYKVFTNSDSRDSTQAGILGAVVGSCYTVLIALIFSLPIGVLTALCLEELMTRNKFTDFFEVSINNLSSTPPIIFGILGLSFYVNFLGLPRSSSLTGGLTLALMMFPILVISTRQAIKSVPIGIKQAAFALGASRVEVITHHVLPLSLPGIITGTILGIARILGESAPLLMVGMVAFVGDIPKKFTEPASVFAVQTYIWAISPDNAFIEKTSVIILVLLFILLSLNFVAFYIKKAFHIEYR